MTQAASHAPPISAELLLEASPDAILVVDEVGRIRLANQRAERLFGSEEPLIGRAIDELIPDPVLLMQFDRLLPISGRRQDGTPVPLELRLAPIHGAPCGLVHVTLWKTRIGEGDVPFERLIEQAPDAIVVADDEGAIRFVNEGAETLFGYDRNALIGESMDVLAPEQSTGEVARPFSVETLAGQPEGANMELVARHSDGTEIDTDVSLASMATKNGDFVLASVHDVTERKRLESEREASEASGRAGEWDVERADFEMQLHQAQRLESIGRLAGGIAHDFNNLLGVIMMYARFVADGLGSRADGRFTSADIAGMQRDIQAVKDVAGRASSLTHKLLTFARREVVAPQVLDANDIVRSMEDLLRRTMGENVDDLRVVLADDALLVKADRGQLDQVIMNLAVNARDAMPGGGTLEVRTSLVTLDVPHATAQTLLPGRYARVAVSDTGAGMSREVAARAFDPFFSTKGKASGSGLGLATVFGIVTQAGGNVTIASSPGAGTTVNVLLPLTDEPRSVASEPRAPLPQVDGDETILLVEDEAMFRQAAMRILTTHGYHVLAASDARDAIAQADAHEGDIHLLLTDIVMPGPSGQDLAGDIVAARPATRVLFMSGYGWEAFDREGPSGNARLLDKPFAASELLHSVRVALDDE